MLLVVATSTNADQSEQVECYACDCSDSISLQPVECQAESVEEYLSANTWLLRAQASLSFHMPTGHEGKAHTSIGINSKQMILKLCTFYGKITIGLYKSRQLCGDDVDNLTSGDGGDILWLLVLTVWSVCSLQKFLFFPSCS